MTNNISSVGKHNVVEKAYNYNALDKSKNNTVQSYKEIENKPIVNEDSNKSISISEKARVLSVLTNEDHDVNIDKVKKLKMDISSGIYNVNAKNIASKMLDDLLV